MRARASSSLMPRDATSRSTAVSTGTSTTTVALESRARPFGEEREVEHDDVVGSTRLLDATGDLDAECRMNDVVQRLQRRSRR